VDLGFLLTGLLTGLREGVEAALIVSIVLAYLAKTGNARHFGRIWLGTGLAVAVSIAVGVTLFATIGGFEGVTEQIFEGVAMTIAAAVVTWMLFWMRRTAANIKGELHAAVDRSLTEGGIFGLTILAFTAVIREGIETALFLLGQATAAGAEATSTLVGAVIGLLIAVLIGFALYRGARVINLRTFFSWTGVALIFIAAGLLSYAVHEFVEAGVITFGTSTAFDISGVLPHDPSAGPMGVVGSILRAIFGYSSTPEWVTLITWVAYVAIVLTLYLRPVRPSRATPTAEQRPASA
jgi:high-affinity iron transporter